MTLLDVAGNVGGFNDALWLIINFFMATYSSLMFMKSVTQDTPILLTQIPENTDKIIHSDKNF